MDRVEVAEVLRKVPLFKPMRAGDVQRLARLASVRKYRSGSVIVREGDTAVAMYCLLNGSVRIVRERTDATAPITLAELQSGGFFGEMSLLDDFPRSASAIAVSETECALISKWDFQRELKGHPELSLALLRLLSQRVRELDRRLVM